MTKRPQQPLTFIRNWDLVDSVYSDVETGKLTTVIKNENAKGEPTRLSEIFHRLPCGIIHKSDTGMGATTSECRSPRNSIIVEPLKATAYLKYKAHGGIFVGAPPASSGAEPVSEKEVIDYLKQPGSKKIFCVSDSLPLVMSLIPDEIKGEFFLLIDETDTHQLDSSFRSVLHIAMEIYKSHSENMRGTVTATPLSFSDPELQAESIIEVIYKSQNPQTVRILNTPSAQKSVSKLIVDHFEKTPQHKLVVALNSVACIKRVIKNILKHPFNRLRRDDIKILCSVKRSKEVGEHYHELNSDILPSKLVFLTAAYFSGFDLSEIFRLVVVIDPRFPNLALSEHRFKQIAGRARNGLVEGLIVYQWQQECYYEEKSALQLLETSKVLLDSLGCLTMNLDRNPHLRQRKLKSLKGIVATNNIHGRNLLFWHENAETFKTAYLSIDSILELNRLQKTVFGRTNGLVSALEAIGFEVLETFDDVESCDTPTESHEWFDTSLRKITDILNSNVENSTIKTTAKSDNTFESEVLEVFQEFGDYIALEHLKQLILKACAKKTGWKKGLKSLKLELFFAAQSPDGTFNHSLKSCFPKGGFYSHTQILEKWDEIKTASPEIGMLMDDAVFLLNRVFTSVRSQGEKDGVRQFYISPTRKIDPRMVVRFKDKIPTLRFSAFDYKAA